MTASSFQHSLKQNILKTFLSFFSYCIATSPIQAAEKDQTTLKYDMTTLYRIRDQASHIPVPPEVLKAIQQAGLTPQKKDTSQESSPKSP